MPKLLGCPSMILIVLDCTPSGRVWPATELEISTNVSIDMGYEARETLVYHLCICHKQSVDILFGRYALYQIV